MEHGLASAASSFMDDQNEMAGRLRNHPWCDTALGLPQHWPEALRTLVGVMLGSDQPMFTAWGPDRLMLYNDGYAQVLGNKHPAALGRPCRDVWAEIWPMLAPLFQRVFEGKAVHEADMLLSLDRYGYLEDAYFSFSYTPVRDAAGAVAGLFCACRETTLEVAVNRRVIAERELLWRNSQDMLVILDDAGIFEAVNPAAARILGWQPEDMTGRSVFDFIHPDDRADARAVLAQAAQGPLPAYEVRFLDKGNGVRWMSWVAAPQGQSIYATGRDISDAKAQAEALRQVEDRLRHAQQLEAIGKLTGGVAHDFNNLLTVIRGSVDLLQRPGLAEARRQRYTAAIAEAADRASRLTAQLLAFARRQALKPEPLDCRMALHALAPLIGPLVGADIHIAWTIPDAPCPILVDHGQFDTTIINLIVNARDAMAGRGALTIGVERMPPPAGYDGERDRDCFAIAVTDTGCGIPADILPSVFEPFFTTKAKTLGTGLGLSQAFGFAKQSGGDIAIVSDVGSGTTVTIYLPVSADQPTVAAARPLDPVDFAGANILLVEDDADVRQFATDVLLDLDHSVVAAENGHRALEHLSTTATPFDIVLSDVMMPGMTGLELGATVRAQYPQTPIVLTSGYSDVLADGGAAGFDLLHKPYSAAQLVAFLKTAISHHRAASATSAP
ncbi:hybrid sensor histidine kinase/response regulator [Sphingomonas ginsenosidivorax]|nr:PAS domain-containing sensor histidine kinase [Sphingomonas ginsenosidivorax]